MTEPALVKLDNVSHAYGERRVLDRINWRLDPGTHWAVIGPSGAGKTTLLKIATGYLWPNVSGTVLRRGEERLDLSEFWREVGWLNEELIEKIPGHQTTLETLLAGVFSQTRLAERPDLQLTDAHREQARRESRRLGLDNKLGQTFKTLSQGEKQLALVGRALMADPELVVLDEPCAGMDPGAREQFLEVMLEVIEAEPEVVFVYITHHVEEILPPFTRTLALKGGTVHARGRTQDQLNAETLSSLYETPLVVETHNGRHWPITRD